MLEMKSFTFIFVKLCPRRFICSQGVAMNKKERKRRISWSFSKAWIFKLLNRVCMFEFVLTFVKLFTNSLIIKLLLNNFILWVIVKSLIVTAVSYSVSLSLKYSELHLTSCSCTWTLLFFVFVFSFATRVPRLAWLAARAIRRPSSSSGSLESDRTGAQTGGEEEMPIYRCTGSRSSCKPLTRIRNVHWLQDAILRAETRLHRFTIYTSRNLYKISFGFYFSIFMRRKIQIIFKTLKLNCSIASRRVVIHMNNREKQLLQPTAWSVKVRRQIRRPRSCQLSPSFLQALTLFAM